MARLSYQAELKALNKRSTYYELETLLGMKHGGQGKSIRRWLTGTRTPSDAMRVRIDRLFEALLMTQLYINPHHEELVPWVRRQWRYRYKLWKNLSIAKILDMTERNYNAAENDRNYAGVCVIIITIEKPYARGRFKFVSEDYCTERAVLLQLLFALQNMEKEDWKRLTESTLSVLSNDKPKVYKQVDRDMRKIGVL